MKRLMGIDKLFFLNSIEATGKALGGQLVHKAVPEQEFAHLAKGEVLL